MGDNEEETTDGEQSSSKVGPENHTDEELSLGTLLEIAADRGAPSEARSDACWRISTRFGVLQRGDRTTVSILIRLLRDPDVLVAHTAASTLGGLSSKRALRPLVTAMKDPRSEDLRYGAAMALRDLGDERAIEPLFEVLADTGEAARVRGQAAESLGCLCLWRDNFTQRLLPGLRDAEAEVRFWTAYALSQVGDRRAIPELQRIQNDAAYLTHWRTVGDEANWAISSIQSGSGRGDRWLPDIIEWVPVHYRDFENKNYMSTSSAYLGGGRYLRAAESLRERRIDALLLTPGADMTYLTGFEHGHASERLLAFVLRADGTFAWIAPAMNVAQIDAHGLEGGEVRGWTDAETYLPALREYLGGASSVAFDDEARAAFLLDLREINAAAQIVKSSTLLRGLRIRKTRGELDQMLAAARTVDETISEAVALCRAGRSEAQIDEGLRKALLKRSPESAVAFTIIASGANSSYPHHETETRKLKQGDVVILDYGTRLEHYHSDITVTCSVGEPSDPEVRKVYRVVWEAQQKALEAIRPGVPCEDIDRAAREHIAAAGYGEFFLHRTGHGLGLQVHEPPYLVAGNKELLEEGMVFSIEPGIYLPNRFGVRLEVIASVGSDGVQLINAPSARDLPVCE